MFSGQLASRAIATKCKQDRLRRSSVGLGGRLLMPATKSKTEVRALGARERMFWFMDQKHPVHLTVTVEVKGITKVQSWRDALDAVQKRHPILSTSIKRNEEGQPALYQVDAAPIPLRVVDGSAQERWELELDREMALPFTPEQAPLIRSVLIHKPQSAVLIMIAHHSIADGMALVFLIRDLLQVLSGGQIEALPFSSTAEELLSKLTKGGEDCSSRGIASRCSSSGTRSVPRSGWFGAEGES